MDKLNIQYHIVTLIVYEVSRQAEPYKRIRMNLVRIEERKESEAAESCVENQSSFGYYKAGAFSWHYNNDTWHLLQYYLLITFW